MPAPTPPAASVNHTGLALALALAAAVSLGLARFSYALLLPPMRADLHWSYFVAGAMNTANAAGYLAGALLAPRWFARFDAGRVLTAGGAAAALALAAHAFARGDAMLVALRTLTGVASAATFVGGGLLAARLAQQALHPGRILGIYYGGTGLGIVLSTLIVPPLPWRAAWLALAAAALACTALTAGAIATARRGPAALATAPAHGAARAAAGWGPMRHALAGYLMFGFGYIGYMTFIVTLLRERGVVAGWIDAFYALLGTGVVASSWLWAGVLQRARGGGALALLNGLLVIATLLPVLSPHPLAVAGSCLLFGCTFLSAVASTTAFVRHNLPPAAWTAGIAAFTIVFAAGQILGPSLTGWLADGPGGLQRGFVASAAALALGAAFALRQRPLARARGATPAG
jgi:predicted MFS family arabinose efflux permease